MIVKVGGIIAYYGLTDWWLNTFSDEEHECIISSYGESLTKGNFSYIGLTDADVFLRTMVGWLKDSPENATIIRKIHSEADRISLKKIMQTPDEEKIFNQEGFPIYWRHIIRLIERSCEKQQYNEALQTLEYFKYRAVHSYAYPKLKEKFDFLLRTILPKTESYKIIFREVIELISQQPGILQSILVKQLSAFNPEQIRTVIYYSAKFGDIIRTKKGRSYVLNLPE